MRVYSHFAVSSLSNTYLVGLSNGNALLVDPGVFDGELLEIIEHHSYAIRCVLLTHANNEHLAGLRTLTRVYSGVRVYVGLPDALDFEATAVAGGERLGTCGTTVSVIEMPGQGRDCRAYYIGGFLFTGTALSAAEYGGVPNPYAKAILTAGIAESVLTLPPETVILPFYGPPSTVAVESKCLPTEDPRAIAGLS